MLMGATPPLQPNQADAANALTGMNRLRSKPLALGAARMKCRLDQPAQLVLLC